MKKGTFFRPHSLKYTQVRIPNKMLKGFIVKNIFVETTAPVSIAIYLVFLSTVEPLLKDTPNKGHNTFDLSIKDKFCGPYRTMAIQFYL